MYEKIIEATEYIQNITDIKPEIALILGSGLGAMAEKIENPVKIRYSDIPNFPVSTVVGHAGELIIGELEGKNVVAMQGRFHYYEGYSQSLTTMPVRVMKMLGAKTLIVTNAAGGANKDFNAGDLMIIKDHINLSGSNPLIGKNDDRIGPRFPDMSDAYNKEYRDLVKKSAEEEGIEVREGVYTFFSGPNYETPAEIRMVQVLGGDAVGMSTVPEVIAAAHCGMKVIGVSCITNMAAGISETKLNHKEVIETTERVKVNFAKLISRVIKNL